ncbi:putative tricarboxylate transport protein [Aspergillus pseudoustus]|uniref:Tricarboxylate transport protein n=1 Tax=Aspergillus pseudoustus TaxID=1810923 RepID=A0ABR4IK50_9EURO
MSEIATPVNQVSQPAQPGVKKPSSSLIFFISGATAGGVESVITYPFEYAKTHSQLRQAQYGTPSTKTTATNNPLRTIISLVQTRGIASIYTGCGSLAAGTMLKAGVRFFFYDNIKHTLSSPRLEIPSFLQGILAGMAAGAAESVLAVTPSERIKTLLIDDARSASRRLNGGGQAVRILLAEQGLRGLYKGLVPTTVKQSATSAVRMGSYNILKDLRQKYGIRENGLTTFLMGAVAGTVTVYATQPFDSVKTRAQGLGGMGVRAALEGILADHGVRGLWRGSTMRLGRLLLSGGIVFSVYEKVRGGLEGLFL